MSLDTQRRREGTIRVQNGLVNQIDGVSERSSLVKLDFINAIARSKKLWFFKFKKIAACKTVTRQKISNAIKDNVTRGPIKTNFAK